eukprot:TRINITY_DN15821_c0_g1_i1.p1 TRINITY_DN15821_c0_g1~~TRINITY_DN15821_c0_g1_i1.p1  ORF type:complete len:204 (+),score=31.74 TRINITY_DN15821_c0_g1_i1:91-702(+)
MAAEVYGFPPEDRIEADLRGFDVNKSAEDQIELFFKEAFPLIKIPQPICAEPVEAVLPTWNQDSLCHKLGIACDDRAMLHIVLQKLWIWQAVDVYLRTYKVPEALPEYMNHPFDGKVVACTSDDSTSLIALLDLPLGPLDEHVMWACQDLNFDATCSDWYKELACCLVDNYLWKLVQDGGIVHACAFFEGRRRKNAAMSALVK